MKTTYYEEKYVDGRLVNSEKKRIDITHYDDDAPVPTDEQLDRNLAAYTQENKVHLKGFICCMGIFFIVLIVLSIINLVHANWGYSADKVEKQQNKFTYFIANLESKNFIQLTKKIQKKRILNQDSNNPYFSAISTKVCPTGYQPVDNLYNLNFYGFSKGYYCKKKVIFNSKCNETVTFQKKSDINTTLYINCVEKNGEYACLSKQSIAPTYCKTYIHYFNEQVDYKNCECPENLFKFTDIYKNVNILQNLNCTEIPEIKPKQINLEFYQNYCYKKYDISGYSDYNQACPSGYTKCYGGVCVKDKICPTLKDDFFQRDGKPLIDLQINRNTFPCRGNFETWYSKLTQVESKYPLSNAPKTKIRPCKNLFDSSSQESSIFNVSILYEKQNITQEISTNDLKLPYDFKFFSNYSFQSDNIYAEYSYLLNVKQTSATCNLNLGLFKKVNAQASETTQINFMSIIRIILIVITVILFCKFIQGSVTTKEKNYQEYIIFGAEVNEKWYRYKTLFEHLMEIRILVFMIYLLTILTFVEWIVYIAKYNKHIDEWKYVENFGKSLCISNSYASNEVFSSIGFQLRKFYGDNKDNIQDLVIALFVGTIVISIFIKVTFSSLRLFLGLKPKNK